MDDLEIARMQIRNLENEIRWLRTDKREKFMVAALPAAIADAANYRPSAMMAALGLSMDDYDPALHRPLFVARLALDYAQAAEEMWASIAKVMR